jgi:hypothetical protein
MAICCSGQLSVATAFGGEEPPALADEPALHFPAPKLQVGLEPPKETQEDSQPLHFPAEGASPQIS